MALPLPVEDIIDIQQLLARYGNIADTKDVDALDRFFTSDAVLVPQFADVPPIRGLAALRDAISRLEKPSHNVTPAAISVDDDGTVRAWSRYLSFRVDASIVEGEYLDVLTRTPRGWRVSSRRIVWRTPTLPQGLPSHDEYGPWLTSRTSFNR
jgi:ketosteroid isomerase-like protein